MPHSRRLLRPPAAVIRLRDPWPLDQLDEVSLGLGDSTSMTKRTDPVSLLERCYNRAVTAAEDASTLRWIDGRPFDAAEESRHYLPGIKRKVRRIYPTLAAYLAPGEMIEAHGTGLIGQNIRCFWIATEQALYIFATPLYRDDILKHTRVPYTDVSSCQLKIRRFPYLVARLGVLRIKSKSGTVGYQRAIPGKQADSLKAALRHRLPEGILPDTA